jgi:hypothetical protein
MRGTVTTTTTAASSALAPDAATRTPAAANPVFIASSWLTLAIIGSAAGGALIGATVPAAGYGSPPPVASPAPSPSVDATDQPPATNCHYTRTRVQGVWRRVRVCG